MATARVAAKTAEGAETEHAAHAPKSAESETTTTRAASVSARSARRVRIERLILHGLDNHLERIELVDEPALLSDESEAFFAQHIEAAISRADWHAHFSDPDGEIPRLCHRLLDTPAEFVAASKLLARRLYAQMRPRTIAPGDFVAAIYTQGDDPTRHIALLKLDPDHRLTRTFSRVGGRYRVTIAAAANLLPDTARLQKCAIISAPTPDADFDVTLLDTQAGPRAAAIATFFYRGFLTTELSPSPRRHTREFLRCCDVWITTYRDHFTPAALITFYSARRDALYAEILDCSAFVTAALPEHPHLHADLAEQLAAMLGTLEDATETRFVIDRAIAGAVVNRVTLELDGGMRLSVPADRFAELVRVEPERTRDNKIRIVIESLQLREAGER